MLKRSILAAAIAAAFALPANATPADAKELAQIRDEIRQMKEAYETRIQALEKRLQEAETAAAKPAPVQTAAAESAPAPATPAPPATASGAAPGSNAFNPAISLILGGTYANLSQDPQTYRISGFIPGGDEIGPGKRSFNLGESELTLSANIDPHFTGKLTFSLTPENEVSVEEAFVDTLGLSNGFNARAGRFLSSVGYLNSQHAHAWDFVDAPLAYQAFFGGQYKQDGLQLRWLAPTDRFFEIGAEAGNGVHFPGSESHRNGFGSSALFAHVGDDINESASWRVGVSYLHATPTSRGFDDTDSTGASVTNTFSGKSDTWMVDGIFKWAPNGNSTHTSFKLQGEYFRRRESGMLAYDTLSQSAGPMEGDYSSEQSGWYVQGVYQFMPSWRVGARYDALDSGSPSIGLVNTGLLGAADFPQLASYRPTRNTLMLDYSPSEFSRLRLQFARDKARSDTADNQLFIQYVMSLGAHGAHSF